MDRFLHFCLFHFTSSKLPFLLRGVHFKQNIVDKVPEGQHMPGNLIPAAKTSLLFCFRVGLFYLQKNSYFYVSFNVEKTLTENKLTTKVKGVVRH